MFISPVVTAVNVLLKSPGIARLSCSMLRDLYVTDAPVTELLNVPTVSMKLMSLTKVAVRVAEARPILVDRRAVDDVERVGAATADDAGVLRIRLRVVEPTARRGERRRYERER